MHKEREGLRRLIDWFVRPWSVPTDWQKLEPRGYGPVTLNPDGTFAVKGRGKCRWEGSVFRTDIDRCEVVKNDRLTITDSHGYRLVIERRSDGWYGWTGLGESVGLFSTSSAGRRD
jgi:hypothetical protein